MNKLFKETIIRNIFLFIAICGVAGYRSLPDYWYFLMWIPIVLGYNIYYKGYDNYFG